MNSCFCQQRETNCLLFEPMCICWQLFAWNTGNIGSLRPRAWFHFGLASVVAKFTTIAIYRKILSHSQLDWKWNTFLPEVDGKRDGMQLIDVLIANVRIVIGPMMLEVSTLFWKFDVSFIPLLILLLHTWQKSGLLWVFTVCHPEQFRGNQSFFSPHTLLLETGIKCLASVFIASYLNRSFIYGKIDKTQIFFIQRVVT